MLLIRNSVLFALWAVLWMAIPMTIVHALRHAESLNAQTLIGAIASVLGALAAPTFVAAALGWSLLNRTGRHLSSGDCAGMALFVVVVGHFLAFAVVSASEHPAHDLFGGALVLLLMHSWFTVPIAWLATALFVRMQKPPSLVARPSDPSSAGSGS
jgi:hypothetical protein